MAHFAHALSAGSTRSCRLGEHWGIDARTGEPTRGDFFGNHPQSIFELVHEPTQTTIYVGPQDVTTLFQEYPGRRNEIDVAREKEESALAEVRNSMPMLQRVQALLGIRPEEIAWQWPSTERFGDREAAQVEAAAHQLEAIWQRSTHGSY